MFKVTLLIARLRFLVITAGDTKNAILTEEILERIEELEKQFKLLTT
jgi:hypothetical protein